MKKQGRFANSSYTEVQQAIDRQIEQIEAANSEAERQAPQPERKATVAERLRRWWQKRHQKS